MSIADLEALGGELRSVIVELQARLVERDAVILAQAEVIAGFAVRGRRSESPVGKRFGELVCSAVA